MTILKTKTILSSVVLVAPLLVGGCSQPPTDAVNAAKSALETARDTEAADYASESMSDAEAAQAALEAEIETQSEKFSLLRSYAKAGELAAAAQAAADKATEDAAAGKEAAQAEATAAMDAVRTALPEVQSLLGKARGRGIRAEIDAMKADLAAVETGFDDFDAAMGEGYYLEALAKAQAAQETLDEVKTEIEAKDRARRQ